MAVNVRLGPLNPNILGLTLALATEAVARGAPTS
jgi:hypothetical protein